MIPYMRQQKQICVFHHWSSVILLAAALIGCAGTKVRKDAPMTLVELIESGARLMWVGAHPDDESLVGSIFAKAGPALHNPLYFFVMNHVTEGNVTCPKGVIRM